MKTSHLIPDDLPEGQSVALKLIVRALQQLEFGSVEITVHEGRIVQVERREKIRPNGGEKTHPLS